MKPEFGKKEKNKRTNNNKKQKQICDAVTKHAQQ